MHLRRFGRIMADDNLDHKHRPDDATSLSPKNDEPYAQGITQTATNLHAGDVAQSNNRQNSNIDLSFPHAAGRPFSINERTANRVVRGGRSLSIHERNVGRVARGGCTHLVRGRTTIPAVRGGRPLSTNERTVELVAQQGNMLGSTWPRGNLSSQTYDPSVQFFLPHRPQMTWAHGYPFFQPHQPQAYWAQGDPSVQSFLPHQPQITWVQGEPSVQYFLPHQPQRSWAQGCPSVQDLNQIRSAGPRQPQITWAQVDPSSVQNPNQILSARPHQPQATRAHGNPSVQFLQPHQPQDLNQITLESGVLHQSQITWAQENRILSALQHPPQATSASSHGPDSPTSVQIESLQLRMGDISQSRRPTGQTCSLCDKDLSVFLFDPGYQGTDPPTVAVLPCGHTFHDECLQIVTPRDQASDPPCFNCSRAEN